jgi:hypothetical protein
MEVEAIRKILQEHKEVLADVIASLLEENPAIIVKAIEKRPDIFSHIFQPIKRDLDNLSGKIDNLSQKMATKDDLKMVIEKMATKIFSSRTDFPKFPFGAGDSASKVPDNMIKK